MTSAIETDQPASELSGMRRMLVLATVIAAAAVQNAATFTATAILPQMQGALSATQDEISWTMTFNLLATAIMLPMVGWLVPRFGTRRVLLWSVTGFTLATLLCSLAQTLESMIVWRIAQGASGAALIPLGQIIILDIFPRRQHGVMIALFGVANTAGAILGPLVGGYLAEHHSWRWAFQMLVPVGVCAGLSALLLIQDQQRPREPPALDWVGFLSLSAAIASLQYILSRGERVDWFDSLEINVSAWICGLSAYVFMAHSLSSARPFVDLRMLRDRNYGIGLVLIVGFGMVTFTPMVLLPPLMQGQLGYPDSDIGQVISYRGLGIVAGFLTCIALQRIDQRLLLATGFGAQVWSGLWMMQLDINAGLFDLSANAFLQGLSVGLVWAPISTTAFRTLAADQRPEAMAMFHLVRSVATSLFIAISVAVVIRSTGQNYSGLAGSISSLNKALAMPGTMGGWSLDTTAGLAALSKEITRQATMVGYLNAFLIHTIVSLVATALVLLVPRAPRG